jgi:hypothetical protein
MTYKRMIKVTKFGRMTFSDLMGGKFNLSNGKEVWEAMCEYTDDRGRVRNNTFSIRALHKEEIWK